MNYKLVLVITVFLISGCKSPSKLKAISEVRPEVYKKGSLANIELIAKTKSGLEKIIGSSIYSPDTKILQFIIQHPSEEIGFRSWKEIWVIRTLKGSERFVITFRESGVGSVDIEIENA